MKLISVKKLKDLMSHCTERDDYLIDQEDLANLLEDFGDDYSMSEFIRTTTMKCIKENEKDYSSGWKFTYP